MHKRGLSDVVTTVLIILISIMAVVILWNFLQPVLKNSAGVNTAQFTTKLSVPDDSLILDPNGQQLSLKIKRDAGEGDIIGFVFGLKDPNGNVRTFRQNVSISELEMRDYVINYSEYPVDDVVSISVTPIFRNNQTSKEQIGQPIVKDVKNRRTYSLPADLVAYWRFDGNYVDSGPEGLNGNPIGSNLQFINGQRGQAVNFNGDASTYVNIDNDNLLNPSEITVVAWINPQAQTQFAPRVVYKEETGKGWNLFYGASQWRFRISASPTALFSNSGTLNQWGQLVGVYSPGNVKIYYNGELKQDTPTTTNLISSTVPVSIGKSYVGAIDEVMIFSRALSLSEIQGLYNEYN